MNMKPLLIKAAVVTAITACSLPLHAERGRNIMNTPHNLSTGGGKGKHDIKSTVEGRICIYCHTPHHATSVTPLWSRSLSDKSYELYKPANMVSRVLQPRGPSRLCLSCHDGTIALGLLAGNTVLDPSLTSFDALFTELDPRKNTNLGTDLSDDHPISFEYILKPELQSPSLLSSNGIKLDQGTYVECNTCHNPHNNINGNFLVTNVDTQFDALCVICHIRTGWSAGSDSDTAHKKGGTRYTQQVIDQVKSNGCINCHLPHNATGHGVLNKDAKEEKTCYLFCHNSAPYTDIRSQFNNIYRHPVQDYDKIHSVTESLPLSEAKKHVKCVDCHNPHRSGWQDAPLDSLKLPPPSPRPLISGPLRGVRVDNSGRTADYEFEVCFKCHAGIYADSFAVNSALRPTRQFTTYDENQRFSSFNPSFHPVTIDRTDRPGAGRSIKAEYQNTMKRIYCIDCHAPHGSNVSHILRDLNEETFPSLGSDYPLCFRCHDKEYLMNPVTLPHSDSASLHRAHVLGFYTTPGADQSRKTPCASCHDPHGVPASRGASTFNGAHLINFDLRYTGPGPSYSSTTIRSCTVAGVCHTVASPYQVY